MTPKWLDYFNMSDAYQRQARFLPALLATLPLIPGGIVAGAPLLQWIALILGGVGLGAVVAVGLSHVASACGNGLQERLWPRWPHDSPTNASLHPDKATVSAQQQKLWYAAIVRLTGLDIADSVRVGDSRQTEAIINDAVVALRHQFSTRPEAERLRAHNIDYGFARNFTGLWPAWVGFSCLSLAVTWIEYGVEGGSLLWAGVATVTFVLAVALRTWVLPRYVRIRARYYAESFFGTLNALSRPSASAPNSES